MKIYFLDEKNNNSNLLKRIEHNISMPVVVKDSKTFRAAKTDVVIVCGFDETCSSNEFLKKYGNMIVLVNTKKESVINEIAFNYNVKDIIFLGCEEEYIADRICRCILNNFCKE